MWAELIHGDCVKIMAEIPENSIDAIVTDPPYGLEFMGKEWDSFRPNTITNRGGLAPGRSERKLDKLAPIAYGIAKRRMTYICASCGKRDKFKNKHGCKNEWNRIYLDSEPKSINMRASYGAAMQLWHSQWLTEAYRQVGSGGCQCG